MMSSSKSVHYVKPDNTKLFQSFGQLTIEVPKAAPHTLDITLTLTILNDNSLTISVKVGDNEPINQPW